MVLVVVVEMVDSLRDGAKLSTRPVPVPLHTHRGRRIKREADAELRCALARQTFLSPNRRRRRPPPPSLDQRQSTTPIPAVQPKNTLQSLLIQPKCPTPVKSRSSPLRATPSCPRTWPPRLAASSCSTSGATRMSRSGTSP